MKRDLLLAGLAAAAISALAIPSMIRSFEPSLDVEIRRVLGELHGARSRGGCAFEVCFGGDGRPIGGRSELARPDYMVTIEADGRASVRTP